MASLKTNISPIESVSVWNADLFVNYAVDEVARKEINRVILKQVPSTRDTNNQKKRMVILEGLGLLTHYSMTLFCRAFREVS